MASCVTVLKNMPGAVDSSIFNMSEMSRAICRALDYMSEPNFAQAIAKARTTIWPGVAKSLGLQHVISADNAAGYAELWHKGGNWYAVTGADPDGSTSFKSEDGLESPILNKSFDWGATWEIKRLNKGADVETATAMFLAQVFGPMLRNGTDCGCAARRTQG